ncbi:MAG: hypothetical protein HC769_07900 [Cyanobacteria bacterium CRU_2_1]|nr:hypothetical protein [Cyanobacteria bacterium RU_5_0]NJR58773.1 hypothetical protein [Cyanobacteria bacterium CRU_2_1]
MANSKIPTEILLSLGSAPMLLVLIGSKALTEMMRDIGQASEEIFRGDRLPILKISPPTPTRQD